MVIYTSICANYLPKAMVLADSVKKFEPDATFVVCLTEREIAPEAKAFKNFDHVILARDLNFENFEKFIFKYSIVEAATAVKGRLTVELFEKFKDSDSFVYLDPDTCVYSPLVELKQALETQDVVLTPHLADPEASLDAVMDNELSALKHGIFNLGFLALKNTTEGKRFASWWMSRLEMFCYYEIEKGVCYDQKWVDLAPCFFEPYILKHPGYNVAPWNLSRRQITCSNDEYNVNEKPLRFFHWTGFDSGANLDMIEKYVPNSENSVYELRDEYVLRLKHHGQSSLGQLKWTYNYYKKGAKIPLEHRRAYRNRPSDFQKYSSPFSAPYTSFLSSNIMGRVNLTNFKPKALVRKGLRTFRNYF